MIRYSKLTNYQIKKILKMFCEDLTATKASNLLHFNRKTVDRYYNLFRTQIFAYSIAEMRKTSRGEFELDESYFGAK
jgi:transposase